MTFFSGLHNVRWLRIIENSICADCAKNKKYRVLIDKGQMGKQLTVWFDIALCGGYLDRWD